MRALFWLALLVVAPLGLLALLLAMMVSATPSVPGAATLVVQDLERGRAVVHELGLKNLRDGEQRRVVLTQDDLEKGLNFLLARAGAGAARVAIQPEVMNVEISLPLPVFSTPRYINLYVGLMNEDLPQQGDWLVPSQVRVGRVPVPSGFAQWLWQGALAMPWLPQSVQPLQVARDMLQSAQIETKNHTHQLALRFVWHGEALKAAMQSEMGLDEATLDIYRTALNKHPERDFARLLGHAFALAKDRSKQADPVTENRAALTALAERVMGSRLSAASRGTAPLARGSHPRPRLAGREDFAQHFSLSAFIAVTGGAGLSDLVGVYKELRDAREGSGFSFNDLAADRAGTSLGEWATRSEDDARRAQRILAGVKTATPFFPRVDDLPEFMSQAEFERRFGGVGAPAYRDMVEKIERRIAALAVYR